MSTKPSWKDCEDCCNAEKPYPHEKMEKIAKAQNLTTGSGYRELVGTVKLSTLCDKCILITPCSACKKILADIEDDSSDEEEEDDASITMEISNFDQEPICSKCIKKQCSDCGEDGGFIKTWYGSIICEECSMRLCNECGGGECTKRCPICDRSCDYGCAATLCEDCGTCDQCNCSKKEDEEEEEEEDNEEEEDDEKKEEKQQSQSFLQYLHKCLMIIGVFLINTINTLKLILLSYSNNLYQNGRRLYLLLLKCINAWYSENRHDRKDS